MNEHKLEYIKSLSLDEVRYELDKIHARLKQVERLMDMRGQMNQEFFKEGLSVLESDYDLLTEELELYSYYFDELKMREVL